MFAAVVYSELILVWVALINAVLLVCFKDVGVQVAITVLETLNRLISDLETLRSEAGAWQAHWNQTANHVDWRFTAEDARIKLKVERIDTIMI